jgi:hypothetical protein
MIACNRPVSDATGPEKNGPKRDPLDRWIELIAHLLAVAWLRSQADKSDESERPPEQPLGQ